MSGIIQLSLFLTGESAVRLVKSSGLLVVAIASLALLLLLIKLAFDD